MQYKDFISIDRQFETAVNLGLDLNKLDKLEEYIPTDASTSILKEYLKDITEATQDKASVLIGPYGKGKSHLILILCALVGMNRDKSENIVTLRKLVDNISKQDKEVAELANNLLEKRKRLIPVVINGGYGDLQQTFLVALKEALERESIQGIIPKTYYEVAIETIKKWKDSYVDTYQVFKEKLKSSGYTVEEFIELIGNYNKSAYELFSKLHIQVCAGSIFNPMISMDIISVYKAVNHELLSYGYDGIFVVFDEFSKFLENTKLHSPGELKILQDFAEFTNRKESKIYLICITHKPIGNYAKGLSQERIMAYRTIEGRFKEIYFVSSSEQNYSLIKNSIKRDDKKFKEYVEENKEFFEKLKDKTAEVGIFPQGNVELNTIVEGCFPLHPMTTFMAIRVSELVAQNERTLFTFLASHQKNTLRTFIETNSRNNAMLTMDRIYDYFREGIKKELSNESIATVYLQAENILRCDLSSKQKKVIKCIALINMINQPNVIQATEKILKTAINESEQTFEQVKNELIRSHYIYQRKSDGVFIFLNNNTVNVNTRIQEYKQIKVKTINRKDILSRIINLGYTLPKAYNDEFEMIRYFKNIFITAKEIQFIKNVDDYLLEQHCDGIIGYLIYDDLDELNDVRQKIENLKDSRLIIQIPQKAFMLDDYLKEYQAISILKEDKEFIENDIPILEELAMHEQDILILIQNSIKEHWNIENQYNRWLNAGNSIEAPLTAKEMSGILSEICRRTYTKTPIIASELINKQNISGAITSARNKLLQNILDGSELSVKGNSPDITITRATITNKGIIKKSFQDIEDEGLKSALKEIKEFFEKSIDNIQNIGELYHKLQSAPFGMRKGIIIIYITLYLKENMDNIIIYNQLKEEELNLDTLKAMDKQPENYNIRLEKETSDRIGYIMELANIFQLETESISFYWQCKLIVDKMKNWFRGLPKYSRELKGEVVKETCLLEFRKQLMRIDINPRQFLFEIIPQIICRNDDLYECAQIINKAKVISENSFSLLMQELIDQVKEIFQSGYKGELTGAIKTWYLQLDRSIEQLVLTTQAGKVFNTIKNINSHDEKAILTQLGYIITGLQIGDWTEETVGVFIQQLKNVLQEIESITCREDSVEMQDEMRLSIDKGSKKIQKLIRLNEMTPLGETLMTNIVDILDEYGSSVESSEKMQVLITVLEQLIQ